VEKHEMVHVKQCIQGDFETMSLACLEAEAWFYTQQCSGLEGHKKEWGDYVKKCQSQPKPPPPPPPVCEINTSPQTGEGEEGSQNDQCGNGGDGNGGSSGASDPNELTGPNGFGVQHFVNDSLSVPYTIEFENDPKATAPAQIVTISNSLSSDLDWSTFVLTGIDFGNQVLPVPEGSQHYQTTVPFSSNGKTFNVEVEAGIHVATGEVYASFMSLDPFTGLPPDVLTGFLPPEDGTGRGQGHILYSIKPKTGIVSGTEIRNVALIQFDFGEIIATNQVDPHDPSQGTDPAREALVTIDADIPQDASNVLELPATVDSPEFLVEWTGNDDDGGSGIGGYDIYVATDGGAFELWLDNTPDTEALFTGSPGHKYAFYSVATDNVGHREDAPLIAEAETVVSDSWHNSANAYDVNGVGGVTTLDVLVLITYINSHPGDTSLPDPPASPPPFYDVNDDGLCSSLDVLEVIGYINSQLQQSGESEATELAFPVILIDPSSMSPHSSAVTFSTSACCTAGMPSAQVDQIQRGNQPPQRIRWGGRETTPQPGEDIPTEIFGQMWDDDAIKELDAVFEELDNVL